MKQFKARATRDRTGRHSTAIISGAFTPAKKLAARSDFGGSRERKCKVNELLRARGLADKEPKPRMHPVRSLLQPICSQRMPPKIDSLLTQPDTLCEGERKCEIKGQRMRGTRGLHLPRI